MELKNEYLGNWWLPNNPDDKVSGVLNITNSEYILDLIGILGELSSINSDKEFDYIYGFTTCGKQFTLCNCFCNQFSFNMPGMITEKYSTNEIFIGKYIEELEFFKIEEAQLSFHHLEKWLNFNAFNINRQERPRISIEYNEPVIQEYKYDSLALQFKQTTNFRNSSSNNELNICISSVVSLKSMDYFNLDLCNKLIMEFRALLSIACLSDARLKMIKLIDIDRNEIYLFRRGMSDASKNLTENNTLFNFNDIIDFNRFIENWRAKYQLITPVIEYYIEANRPGIFNQISFLMIVQAVEAFSRRTRKNWVDEELEHRLRVDAIVMSVEDEEYKNWLTGVLEHINEPSFINRLTGLSKETDFLFQLGNKKIKKIAFKASVIRNYYTHFNEKLLTEFTVDDMYYIGRYYLFVLRTLILVELGFAEDYIIKKMNLNNELAYVISNINEI